MHKSFQQFYYNFYKLDFMLLPTSTFLVAQNKRSDKNAQSLNTIKIDFSKISAISPSDQPYTECPKCCMFLTEDDVTSSTMNLQSINSFSSFNNISSVCSIEEMSVHGKSQKPSYKGIKMSKTNKIEESSDNNSVSWKKTKWYCRYCKEQNIANGELHYVPNNYKTITKKNINRSILPPLILFVIDQSGSMGQTISFESKSNEYQISEGNKKTRLLKLSKEINEMIKKSSFYNKTKHKEKQQLQKIGLYEEKLAQQKKKQQNHYYSKLTFFMAVIEEYIPKIKAELGNNQFRVGFIFFNQSIFILKPSVHKFIPTYSPKNLKKNKRQFPFDQKFINFDNFDALFKEGKKFDRFFGDCNLKNLDLSKVMFENLEVSGQTSLGPALVFGMGILSVHDIGSRMIVISDAKPNFGVLASQNLEENEDSYTKIMKFIKQRQISLGVLNWIEENSKKNVSSFKGHKIMDTINMQFQKFLKEDKDLIQQITLDFSIGFSQLQVLDEAKISLVNLLKRGSIGKTLKINIKCDCSSIKIQKFKYDHIDFRFMKFMGSRNKNWIQMYVYKLKQSQFLFPVFTQIVIRYEDVFTKEQCVFMSYCSHKIIKSIPEQLLSILNDPKKQLKLEQSQYEYFEYEGFRQQNLNELESLEYINKFDYENVIPQAYSSKMMRESQQFEDLNFGNTNSWNKLAENINRLNSNSDDIEDYL